MKVFATYHDRTKFDQDRTVITNERKAILVFGDFKRNLEKILLKLLK